MSTQKLWAGVAVAVTLSVCGCASRQEKTAPCKRPAELTSYGVEQRLDCAAMHLINPPSLTAQQAIDRFAREWSDDE